MHPTAPSRGRLHSFFARAKDCVSPVRGGAVGQRGLYFAAPRHVSATRPSSQWGTRPAIDRALSGYTPQISQRRAHTTVLSGGQVHMRHGFGAQEEEQLWAAGERGIGGME